MVTEAYYECESRMEYKQMVKSMTGFGRFEIADGKQSFIPGLRLFISCGRTGESAAGIMRSFRAFLQPDDPEQQVYNNGQGQCDIIAARYAHSSPLPQ